MMQLNTNWLFYISHLWVSLKTKAHLRWFLCHYRTFSLLTWSRIATVGSTWPGLGCSTPTARRWHRWWRSGPWSGSRHPPKLRRAWWMGWWQWVCQDVCIYKYIYIFPFLSFRTRTPVWPQQHNPKVTKFIKQVRFGKKLNKLVKENNKNLLNSATCIYTHSQPQVAETWGQKPLWPETKQTWAISTCLETSQNWNCNCNGHKKFGQRKKVSRGDQLLASVLCTRLSLINTACSFNGTCCCNWCFVVWQETKQNDKGITHLITRTVKEVKVEPNFLEIRDFSERLL